MGATGGSTKTFVYTCCKCGHRWSRQKGPHPMSGEQWAAEPPCQRCGSEYFKRSYRR